ncbi:hypothetical protein [Sphingomonas sp. PAMC 26621]|uniref:hypothetical protein n=1 Tax=Sphingomonas sp. PAMC 26621 TaxID=1112213 RepID=UPI00031BFA02|nr:hypothetical protein [Sphingomonas sp. PAMC 26621]
MPDEPERDTVTEASALMREALRLLDAAGVALAALHLEQALNLVQDELAVR